MRYIHLLFFDNIHVIYIWANIHSPCVRHWAMHIPSLSHFIFHNLSGRYHRHPQFREEESTDRKFRILAQGHMAREALK